MTRLTTHRLESDIVKVSAHIKKWHLEVKYKDYFIMICRYYVLMQTYYYIAF